MDPYLELHWGDVHHNLITYARDQLQPKLPDSLRARVGERVFVDFLHEGGRSIYPDVHVTERRTHDAITRRESGGVATVEPLVVKLADEPVKQGFIEIIDAGSGHRVISVIEFLSPSNKIPGDGQRLYLKKQAELREASINLVEIDLTRAGRRIQIVPPERIPLSHRTTYQVCVQRGATPFEVEVYPVPMQEPLPTIAIPLRPEDRDAPLDLQSLVETCYKNGRYDDLDYSADPIPPLSQEDAKWADELLRSRGLRGSL
jgi:hypothetical protein